MQSFESLPKSFKLVFSLTIVMGIIVACTTILSLVTPGIRPSFADKDFANYWIAAHMLFDGNAKDLFGPQSIYFGYLHEAFGDAIPWHNWSYPPHFLLLIWPLGFFGYKVAMLLFLATTGLFFFWAYRDFVGRHNLVAQIAAGPFIVHNFWVAQNGYLSASFALGALALRERRPIVAGILLGFLTIKPQLGFLFPVLLLVERRWSVIVSAIVTTVALVTASAAVFGLQAWHGYIHEVLPYQALVMRELGGTFLAMLPSLYGALRNWGVGPDMALAVHLSFAIPIALISIILLFRAPNDTLRSIILLVATFLITPYALTYDLGMFVAALALLGTSGSRPNHGSSVQSAILAVAMALPVVMMPFGDLKLSIAPLVMLAVFIMTLRQVGAARATNRQLVDIKAE